MKILIDKKYLIISFIAHLILFIAVLIVTQSNRIKRSFIVFGAHSKGPSRSFYKSFSTYGKKNYVPFAGHSGGTVKGYGVGKKAGVKRGSLVGRGKSGRHNVINKKLTNNKVFGNTKNKRVKSGVLSHTRKERKIESKEFSGSAKLPVRSGTSITKDKGFYKKNLHKELQEERGVCAVNKKMKKIKKERDVKRALEQEMAKQEVQLRVKEERKRQEDFLRQKLEEEQKKMELAQQAQLLKQKQEESVSESIDSEQDNEQESVLEDAVVEEEDLLEGDEEDEALVLNLAGSSDPELSVYRKHIQNEVARLWRPPLGVPKGTTCKLFFIVNDDGEVDHAEIVARSPVLIYDLSILRVAYKFNFDKCLWGKKFTIEFQQ
jgi:flagellar biosynthesis GTPase FlhF